MPPPAQADLELDRSWILPEAELPAVADLLAAGRGRAARVRVGPNYQTYSERVLVTAGRREQRTVPAVYEWAERQVLVEAAHTEHRIIPATYRSVTETVVIENVVLRRPVKLTLDRHTDGKSFGPGASLFGDASARNMLDDIISSNPSQQKDLVGFYSKISS